MGYIQKTVDVFETLRKHQYRITIENGEQFVLSFSPEHYHHLVGYQHLTDLSTICKPPKKDAFYRKVRKGDYLDSAIICSCKFSEIQERFTHFGDLTDILSAGSAKIIVEYDNSKNNSNIIAKYYLFKRIGNPLFHEEPTYSILFIGYNSLKSSYYPATFVIEHSVYYLKGQNMLNCSIEIIS